MKTTAQWYFIYKLVMSKHTEHLLNASDLFLKKSTARRQKSVAKPLLEDTNNNKKALYMSGGCYYFPAITTMP